MGESDCISNFPYSLILPLHYASCAIYRFYPYSHPRSFGTCNGCILRSNNLRGKSDTQIVLRNCIDYPGCDIYYSRKQYYDTFGTVQEVVSTIAFEAYKKIDSTGYPSDRRNTSFTTSSPLSLSTFHKSERYFCILFAASIRLARMDNQI